MTGLILIRLLLGYRAPSHKNGNERNKHKPTHAQILARCRVKSCWDKEELQDFLRRRAMAENGLSAIAK